MKIAWLVRQDIGDEQKIYFTEPGDWCYEVIKIVYCEVIE